MSLPKKKTSRSRRDIRRYASGNQLSSTEVTICEECGEPVRPHRICGKLFDCAYYQSRFQTKGKESKAKEAAPAAE